MTPTVEPHLHFNAHDDDDLVLEDWMEDEEEETDAMLLELDE